MSKHIGFDLGSPEGDWSHYGNLSATPADRAVELRCVDCRVIWLGCMDVCECPKCGKAQDVLALQKTMMPEYLIGKSDDAKIAALKAQLASALMDGHDMAKNEYRGEIQHLESLLKAIVEARAECLNKRSLDADSKLFDAIKAADYLEGNKDA